MVEEPTASTSLPIMKKRQLGSLDVGDKNLGKLKKSRNVTLKVGVPALFINPQKLKDFYDDVL